MAGGTVLLDETREARMSQVREGLVGEEENLELDVLINAALQR